MARRTDGSGDEWGERVQAPPVADGFAVKEEGLEVEGPLLSRGIGEYGPYYVIKVQRAKGKMKTGDEVRPIPVGAQLAISEVNGLRPLAERMKAGPTAVRIAFLGKEGNAWDIDLRVKSLF